MKILNARDTKHWAYGQTQNFIDTFGSACILAQEKHGFDAVTVLSQFALETGYGKKILMVNTESDLSGVYYDSKNLGNIKAFSSWNGKKGWKRVTEWIDGKQTRPIDAFRVYDSYKDAIDDYIALIKRNYPEAYKVRKDGNKYLYHLTSGKKKYATDPIAEIDGDPSYVEKIQRIRQQNFISEV